MHGTIIFGRRSHRKKQRFTKTEINVKSPILKNPHRLSEYAFKQRYGVDITTKRIKLDPELIRITEKTIGTTFDRKPVLIVYTPKKIRASLLKKKGWDGCALIPRTDKYKAGGTYEKMVRPPIVIIPKSHLKNHHVRNMKIIEQLGFILASQEEYKRPTNHQQSVDLEIKYEKKMGTTRTGMLNRSRSLFNNPESWK